MQKILKSWKTTKTTSSVFWILNDFHLKLKIIILLLLKVYFDCFAKGHIHNVVSTSPNVVQPEIENDNVVLTLFISTLNYTTLIRQWGTQRCFNADLRLLPNATSCQPKTNVEPTLKCLLGWSTCSVAISKLIINTVIEYLIFKSRIHKLYCCSHASLQPAILRKIQMNNYFQKLEHDILQLVFFFHI